MDERVTITVPVVIHGTPAGVKEGGTVDHVLHEIEIECTAADIPQEIRIEIAHLDVGEQVSAGDIELPSGVSTGVDPDELVVICRAPVEEEEEEAAPAEEAEVTMPEVITERKEGEGPADSGDQEEK